MDLKKSAGPRESKKREYIKVKKEYSFFTFGSLRNLKMILLGPCEAISARILRSEVVFVLRILESARISPSEVVFVRQDLGSLVRPESQKE